MSASQSSLFDAIDRMHAENFNAAIRSGLGLRFGLRTPLDPEADGDERKQAAMAATLNKKPSQIYKGHLEAALFQFPPRARFTVEQLTGFAGRPPEGVHYNAVGAIVNGMATRGLIRKTGRMLKAERPGMHATELAEWELVRYPERQAA